MEHIKSYTNGNRSVEISKVGTTFKVYGMVFDGVKWQCGKMKSYMTEKQAVKSAEKEVAAISAGWTANKEWTIS